LKCLQAEYDRLRHGNVGKLAISLLINTGEKTREHEDPTAERGGNMKSRVLTYIVTMAVIAVVAIPAKLVAQDSPTISKPTRYSVINLGALGGTFSSASGINNSGWLTGDANVTGDETEHATVWRNGVITDLGTLGGPNSVAQNEAPSRGLVVGVAQTSNLDPYGETYVPYTCSYTTFCQGLQHQSLGFAWQEGSMTALPTLGGNNSWAFGANKRGQVVGLAETPNQDPTCVPPQVLDWEAVIWDPQKNQIKELPPLPGDHVGAALAINDRGQVVGASGVCESPSPAAFVHALLWQDGSLVNLGNLGGAVNNIAVAINNGGEVVGGSDSPGDITQHAFFWQNGTINDLGTLPGDFSSFAYGINNASQVVGQSCDASGNCRAFLWQNGVMTDLNALIPPSASVFLLSGNDINEEGEIAAQGVDQSTGEILAFLAVPCNDQHVLAKGCAAQVAVTPTDEFNARAKVVLPESIREQLRQRRAFKLFRRGLTAERHNDQSNNNLVKNLDTLEGTSTIAECIGDPSSVIADTRPDANTHALGWCQYDTSTYKLTGYCLAPSFFSCLGSFKPQQCPVGAPVKSRGSYMCGYRHVVPVDYGRPQCTER
jgi:probable HAF family extracellular repeat protein